jgi:predicted enzyme related to lactoylglutathione lyase
MFLTCDMPTIIHFEIPADDVERSKKFYSELFGWSFEKLPKENTPEGIEYRTIATKDEKGNNGVNGGMIKRIMPEQQGITNYVYVKSVDDYTNKVEQLGGKIKVPKSPIPNMGYFAVCSDTENNTFGVVESTAKV